MSASMATIEDFKTELTKLDEQIGSVNSEITNIKLDIANIKLDITNISEDLTNIARFNEQSESHRIFLDETTKDRIDVIRDKIDNVSAECSREIQSMSVQSKEIQKLQSEQLDLINRKIDLNGENLKGIRERDLTSLAKNSDVKNMGADLKILKETDVKNIDTNLSTVREKVEALPTLLAEKVAVDQININLNAVKEKVETLPTLKNIKEKLLDEHSGLASKKDLNKTNVQVSRLNGMVSVNIAGTIIATFMTIYMASHKTSSQVKNEQTEVPPYSNNISNLKNISNLNNIK